MERPLRSLKEEKEQQPLLYWRNKHYTLKAEPTVKKENLFSILNNPEFVYKCCLCVYTHILYTYITLKLLILFVCVCKKVILFQHFFHLNLNGLGTTSLSLYQLHFKSAQMFCFKYAATIHLTCITHKKYFFFSFNLKGYMFTNFLLCTHNFLLSHSKSLNKV